MKTPSDKLSEAMKTALRQIADKEPYDGRSGIALHRRGLVVWLKANRFGLTPAGRRKLKEIGK